MSLTVDMKRLRNDIEGLRSIGRTESDGVSRTSFSAADRQARDWYAARCGEASLTLAVDALGNMTARAPEEPSELPPVWTGSHIDSVPNGGHLDGALGAVAALECLRRITEEKLRLSRPVRAVVFSDEEGNYSRRLGSAGLVKGFTEKQLQAMIGRDDDRLADRLSDWGWSMDAAARTKLPPDSIHSFVELHIEQGSALEAAGIDIGVVTSIVGVCGARVEFTGRADHAGTTAMSARKDALLAGAHLVTQLPAIAASISDRAVATCGLIRVMPGSANVVPGSATLLLDFRDPDADRLRSLAKAIEQAAADIGGRHELEFTWRQGTLVEPVPLDEDIRRVIAGTADELSLSHVDMPSGAGHDAQNLAEITRSAMIFVPSVGGRSHSPAEDTSWDDIENGANVLLRTLISLAG